MWRSVLKLQHTGQWRTLAAKTPTLGAYREKTYGDTGDVLGITIRELGFGWKRLGLPAWKGANDENVQFFVRACIQAYGFRLFVFGLQLSAI